jgi:hypothetical protein
MTTVKVPRIYKLVVVHLRFAAVAMLARCSAEKTLPVRVVEIFVRDAAETVCPLFARLILALVSEE